MASKYLFFVFFGLSILVGGVGLFVVNAVGSLNSEKDGLRSDLLYVYEEGFGAGGYDVVAFFEESEAIKGNKHYVTNFAGMQWFFKTTENRAQFMANPAKYLPQYGGHCAYSAVEGKLVRGDPLMWSIHDGNLYFYRNEAIRRTWLSSADEFIAQADNAWVALTTK